MQDDLISRQAVIDSLHSKFADGFDSDRWWNSMSVLYAINKVPPVNPTKTGWHIAHGMYDDRFWCSCGYIKPIDSSMSEWKYCPVCGAKQEIEEA